MMHLVPCKETSTAEDVAQMFLEHVWKLHGTPKRTVSDRGTTFNKFLKALYKSLQSLLVSLLLITHELMGKLRSRINGWRLTYLPSLIIVSLIGSKATGKLPFEIVYGRSPVISPLLEPTGSPIADDRAKQLAETIHEVQASIKWAQERYKQADTGKPPLEFQPGDKVRLLALNITLQRPNKKPDHRQYCPFPVIERVGSHAYCLSLPETMKIHDVFHVNSLSAIKQDTEFHCTFTPPPPVITAQGEEEVRWTRYAPHGDTWEPAKDLQHCKDKLRNFFPNYPDAPAADNAIPANARKVKRGEMVKQLSKSKTARFATS
ncbi:hypothetical protein RHS01_09619 [Rhizoctonia solani]|uniref:Integrase catalytic domain-containing protein n=1 Tax=Rhizoctonia solani TaxID=456999 RepID=A0A8H7M0S8_9AGAM|nr:hypothetical protein RHS01_09619 [Rhizoctonia solani]